MAYLPLKDVIDTLKSAGIRDKVKIMVGDAPVSENFANEIGADGYSDDANSAVALAGRRMKESHNSKVKLDNSHAERTGTQEASANPKALASCCLLWIQISKDFCNYGSIATNESYNKDCFLPYGQLDGLIHTIACVNRLREQLITRCVKNL